MVFIVSICRLTLYAYFANVNTTYKNKNFLINYAQSNVCVMPFHKTSQNIVKTTRRLSSNKNIPSLGNLCRTALLTRHSYNQRQDMRILKIVFKISPLHLYNAEPITLLDASFTHCSSTFLSGGRGEKHKIVQIAAFPITVTDCLKNQQSFNSGILHLLI